MAYWNFNSDVPTSDMTLRAAWTPKDYDISYESCYALTMNNALNLPTQFNIEDSPWTVPSRTFNHVWTLEHPVDRNFLGWELYRNVPGCYGLMGVMSDTTTVSSLNNFRLMSAANNLNLDPDWIIKNASTVNSFYVVPKFSKFMVDINFVHTTTRKISFGGSADVRPLTFDVEMNSVPMGTGLLDWNKDDVAYGSVIRIRNIQARSGYTFDNIAYVSTANPNLATIPMTPMVFTTASNPNVTIAVNVGVSIYLSYH